MTTAYRDAVPGFSVYFLASVSINGFVSNNSNPSGGSESIHDKTSNDSSKSTRRPLSMREDSMKGRGVKRLNKFLTTVAQLKQSCHRQRESPLRKTQSIAELFVDDCLRMTAGRALV